MVILLKKRKKHHHFSWNACILTEMGVSGICDIVEFHRDECGESHCRALAGKLSGLSGGILKRVSRKEGNDADALQLTRRLLCLEEMLLQY